MRIDGRGWSGVGLLLLLMMVMVMMMARWASGLGGAPNGAASLRRSVKFPCYRSMHAWD